MLFVFKSYFTITIIDKKIVFNRVFLLITFLILIKNRNMLCKQNLSSHIILGSIKLWKSITFFVAFPIIGLAMANCYLKHQEEHSKPPPEFVHYPYLKIMNKVK